MKGLRLAVALAFVFGIGVSSRISLAADRPGDIMERGRQAAQQGDSAKALQEIFILLQQQQQTLDLLMHRSQDQQKLMEQQKEMIQKQQEQIETQTQQLAQSPRLPEGFADNYSADQMYKTAYDIQHIAIFDVRRKDAPPYFRKAIEEFSKLVEAHPTAEKADDAQFRVAKIYHRYLKEYSQAVREYELLLERYPDSEYVDDAREALSDLR